MNVALYRGPNFAAARTVSPLLTQPGFPLPSFGPLTFSGAAVDILNHIDESFFSFDRHARLLYLNKPGKKILQKAYGLTLEIGENILQKLPAERRQGFSQIIEKVLAGESAEYEVEIVATRTWLHCSYFPGYCPNGKINGCYGVVKDITAQKEVGRLEQKAERIEQNLFQSRLLFEQFMQNSPLVAWLTDQRGVMQYMNPVYMATYGFTREDFGRHIYELFSATVALDYHFNNRRVIETGLPLETTERGITSDGNVQVLKIYKFPLMVGEQVMVGGWAVDITAQVELQEKLINSVERYEYVNEATSDAIYDWTIATGRIYRGNGFEALFGYTEKEVSIRTRLGLIHPDDLEHYKKNVFAALRNEHEDRWKIEYRFRDSSGNYKTIVDKAFIIRSNKRAIRVIGALQDISAQIELQQQLVRQEKQSQQELIKSIIETQEKERRKLSVELHDNVNQMLASCKLMLEVATEGGDKAKMLTEKTYQSIQTVIDEIRRISHELNPSAIVDVGLVDAIEQLIGKINLAGKINIQFFPNRLKYTQYLTEEDKIAIFRIVQEQLNNILKHANATTVVIRLEVIEGLVRLCIKDDGIGFDPSKCKKGLGLRNIYNRVEYYGGSINITTGVGKGCKMCLTFRIKSVAETSPLKIA